MKKRPIFQKILIPLMGLIVLEILILVGSLLGQGLMEELSGNEKAIVNEKISGRAEYLNNIMQNNWMNLEYTVTTINEITQELLDEGTISLETIDDSSSQCVPLLNAVSDKLISMMRSSRVSGVFLILNTEDLTTIPEEEKQVEKPGIYLRDQDPTSQYSSKNQDLLIQRAPISVIQNLGIGMDHFWKLNFTFDCQDEVCEDLFFRTWETAQNGKKLYSWQDLGHWVETSRLFDQQEESIVYTVPLILGDESVYGVLGVEISMDYFASLFPYEMIAGDSQGAYFMAKETADSAVYRGFFGDGNLWLEDADDGAVRIDTDDYYIYTVPLTLYNSNTPYYNEKWIFGGAVSQQKLNAFAMDTAFTVSIAVLVTFMVGAVGSLVISYQIQRPVSKLSQEIKELDPSDAIHLRDTGILEFDQMSRAVEQLSRDVIEGDKKLTKIIRMASVKLAGFQIDYEKNSVFVTPKFFEIFGRNDVDEKCLSVEKFGQIMEELRTCFLEKSEITDSYVYHVHSENTERYIQLRYQKDGDNLYGLCEDITQTALEKRILRYERDHDLLTDLYNRRAFWRELQNLFFYKKDSIHVGALMMLDMDHLKEINDTYGHEYGDRYIVQMGNALRTYLPANALYARISGDEFYVFLYGGESKEKVEEEIQRFKEGLAITYVELPDHGKRQVQASGGIAWYPRDSISMEELFKYADYAMYSVKSSKRGDIRSFESEEYEKQAVMNNNRNALNSLILNRSVKFAFQPIVDAHTGKIFAYEALMRPYMSEMIGVDEILDVARREGKMAEIEELTWTEALNSFNTHVVEGRIAKGTYLFLNSIPNQRLSKEQEEKVEALYGRYMHMVVLEMTEEENIDVEKWEGKQVRHRKLGGKIALDDYGTGYNSEKMLLSISPDFIKVDMAIVKDIWYSTDRQAMVTYIVNYAHERNKHIIAEGVENARDAQMVIELGVDYLQGYFFGRPKIVPEGVSAEALEIIQRFSSEQ